MKNLAKSADSFLFGFDCFVNGAALKVATVFISSSIAAISLLKFIGKENRVLEQVARVIMLILPLLGTRRTHRVMTAGTGGTRTQRGTFTAITTPAAAFKQKLCQA